MRYRFVFYIIIVSVLFVQPALQFSNVFAGADFTGCTTTKDDPPVWVKFTDTSTGTPVNWEWDFGDGGTSFEQDPLYPYYEGSRCYTVSLTVAYDNGTEDTAVKEDCVCIGEFPPTLLLDPESHRVDAAAGTVYFSVDNNDGTGQMRWLAFVSSGQSWLSVSSGKAGTNTGRIGVSYRENTSPESRTGTILVFASGATNTSVEVSVTQAGKQKRATAITCELSAASLYLGETVTVSGIVIDESGTAVEGAAVEISLISPSGIQETKADITAADGTWAVQVAPDRSGTWLINASCQGDASYNRTESTAKKLTVIKPGTLISIEPDAEALTAGSELTVSGTLDTAPYTTQSREGLAVSLLITGPDGEERTAPETTTDPSGEFCFSGVSVFDMPGSWQLQASFAGNERFDAAVSKSRTVTVLEADTTGYALIVQGRIAGEEGIDAHKKTVESIYTLLTERNIKTEHIRVLGYNLSETIAYDTPSPEMFEAILTQWARDNITLQPAPLYIILVGHGESEKFYIDPYTITADDLDEWLDELEAVCTGYDFAEYPVFVLIGTCRSGSFIPQLSRRGRVIISSAADNETASRGPFDGELRTGSFFLSEFFTHAAKGESIGRSFNDAAQTIASWTAPGRQKRTGPGKRIRDAAGQHPRIDDNGDAVGSTASCPSGDGDGQIASEHHIGTAAGSDRLEVVRVCPPVTLSCGEEDPDLWAKVNNHEQVKNVRLEIKPPDADVSADVSTGQFESSDFFTISPESIIKTDDICRVSLSGQYDFTESGTYEVFFVVTDKTDNQTVTPKKTLVYRQPANPNSPPEGFDLISPADGAELHDSPVLFDWETAADPEGDRITYTLKISRDMSFDNATLIVSDIQTSSVVLNIGSDLKDGTTYYWCVEATDEYGSSTTSSEIWSFYKDFNNIVLGFLEGYVTDADGLPLSDVNITSTCGADTVSDGGVFYLTGPEGTFKATASLSDYETRRFSFRLLAGETTYVTLPLDLLSDNGTADTDNGTDSEDGNECIFSKFINDRGKIELIRLFRDEVLTKSDEGRKYIEMYYKYSPELVNLLATDSRARGVFLDVFKSLLPKLRLLCKGESVSYSEKEERLFLRFIHDFEEKMPWNLRLQEFFFQLKNEVNFFKHFAISEE